MPSGSTWGTTPRQSIEDACARRGREDVAAACIALLEGGSADPALVASLGGPGAGHVLDGGVDGVNGYWLRVWGARGLLWAWDPAATSAIVDALDDSSWRVREMAARVAARHHVADALPALEIRRDDENARVRSSIARAIATIMATEA